VLAIASPTKSRRFMIFISHAEKDTLHVQSIPHHSKQWAPVTLHFATIEFIYCAT
jgi:hypothetical protein